MSEDNFDMSLLNKNLSDIEDLPSFGVPPKGTYVFLISGGTKTINNHPSVVFDLTVANVVEYANQNEQGFVPAKEGDKTGIMFALDNEWGPGSMKKFLAPFAAHFNEDNAGKLVTSLIQNILISATMDHKVDKTDKTKVYPVLKNIVIQ